MTTIFLNSEMNLKFVRERRGCFWGQGKKHHKQVDWKGFARVNEIFYSFVLRDAGEGNGYLSIFNLPGLHSANLAAVHCSASKTIAACWFRAAADLCSSFVGRAKASRTASSERRANATLILP